MGGVAAQHRLETLSEGSRSGRGEGDREDARGRDPAIADQVGDAPGERGRLAAARASQDAERSLSGGNRGALLGREAGQVHNLARSGPWPRRVQSGSQRRELLRRMASFSELVPAHEEGGVQDVVRQARRLPLWQDRLD